MEVTWDGNTRTAYLSSVGGVALNELRWFNATPDFTSGHENYFTKSRNAETMTTATGKTFEFGYVNGNPEENRGGFV